MFRVARGRVSFPHGLLSVVAQRVSVPAALRSFPFGVRRFYVASCFRLPGSELQFACALSCVFSFRFVVAVRASGSSVKV